MRGVHGRPTEKPRRGQLLIGLKVCKQGCMQAQGTTEAVVVLATCLLRNKYFCNKQLFTPALLLYFVYKFSYN
jgi:hypothetical protein